MPRNSANCRLAARLRRTRRVTAARAQETRGLEKSSSHGAARRVGYTDDTDRGHGAGRRFPAAVQFASDLARGCGAEPELLGEHRRRLVAGQRIHPRRRRVRLPDDDRPRGRALHRRRLSRAHVRREPGPSGRRNASRCCAARRARCSARTTSVARSTSITRQPGQATDASAPSSTYGSYNSWRATISTDIGTAGRPRAAASTVGGRSDGWQDRPDDDGGEENRIAARAALRWTPSDAFESTLALDYVDQDQVNYPNVMVVYDPNGARRSWGSSTASSRRPTRAARANPTSTRATCPKAAAARRPRDPGRHVVQHLEAREQAKS